VDGLGGFELIQFGMPTLIERPGFRASLDLCNDLGLSFVEINMNLPEYQIAALDVSNMKKMLDDSGQFVTIHLDENLNICDFNPLIANANMETILNTITLAKQLNIPILNMHMAEGVYFTLPDRKEFLFEKYSSFYLDKLYEFRSLCEEAIGENDITICIENCGPYRSFQKEGIELLLESSCFGLTFDIGHDFSSDNANEQFILAHRDKLKHMHVHDANRKGNHLALGTGEIDIASKLEIAKQNNCRCVLEIKTIEGLKQSVGRLLEYEIY